jgi:CBS domain-containing protein
MYEKNIVGVYHHQTEYPVFKYQTHDERRIDPNQYGQQALHAFSALLGEVDTHDPLEPWRQESEQHRAHPDGQHSGKAGAQAEQQPKPQASPAQRAAQAEAAHEVDEMIEARVRAHILPAPPRPALQPAPAEHLLQLMQRHLSQVTEALPEDQVIQIEHAAPVSIAPGTLRLRDVMSRKVVCVRADVSLEQAASVCNRRGFSGLPVIDAQQRLVGEFSIQGLMRDLYAPAAQQHFAQHDAALLEARMLAMLNEPVSQHMRRELITVSPVTSVRNACRLMQRQSLRRLIVTEGDSIVGLFSAQDAVRLLAATHFAPADR